MDIIQQGTYQHTVSMQMIPEAAEDVLLYGEEYDEDGDCIFVRQESRFLDDGSAHVIAEFAQGTSPDVAARVFRKFADMLEGRHGMQIANLGYTKDDFTHAVRLADGDVHVFNFRAMVDEYRREDEDSWDDESDYED